MTTTPTTPLEALRNALNSLMNGQKVLCPNSREEILKAKENLTRNRSTIKEADYHIEYIDAMLVAEAEGKLNFKD
jgi:hypothetical protein